MQSPQMVQTRLRWILLERIEKALTFRLFSRLNEQTRTFARKHSMVEYVITFWLSLFLTIICS